MQQERTETTGTLGTISPTEKLRQDATVNIEALIDLEGKIVVDAMGRRYNEKDRRERINNLIIVPFFDDGNIKKNIYYIDISDMVRYNEVTKKLDKTNILRLNIILGNKLQVGKKTPDKEIINQTNEGEIILSVSKDDIIKISSHENPCDTDFQATFVFSEDKAKSISKDSDEYRNSFGKECPV